MAEPPNLLDSIEAELREERAATLGRAGKAIEVALQELAFGVPE